MNLLQSFILSLGICFIIFILINSVTASKRQELKRLLHNLIFKSCDNCKYEFVTNIHPDPCYGCKGKRFKHWSRK